ncbi:MAG: FKBP-type peptidyl-prolyl cis-trans isomerase [Bythopirellula sp.]
MRRTLLGMSGALLVILGGWVVAQETLPVNGAKQPAQQPAQQASVTDQYSYAIGLDMGTSFRSSDTPLNIENLVAGIQDGINGAKPKFDRQTCGLALRELNRLMRSKAMVQQEATGKAFLAENRTKDGVQVTKTGLQYKVIQPGSGATPAPTDTVKCNYRGTLIDGTEFDASAKHGGPASFPVNRVIPGWTEALQLMKVGAKWQLFIPAELAYGNNPPGPPIEAGSVLVFDIELLGIEGK